MIAIPSNVQGRWTSFWQSKDALILPPRVVIRTGRANHSPAQNRNGLIAIAQELGVQWMWFLDDDLVLPPDTLVKLLPHLERDDVDAVVPLSFSRGTPFEAIWWQTPDEVPLTLLQALPTEPGLVPLTGCTFGGLLVKMSAIARMTKPYVTIGQLHPEKWMDDVWFCRNLRRAGGKIWGDPSVCLGHTTDLEVWPYQSPEFGWTVMFARNSQPFLMQPWGDQPEPKSVSTTPQTFTAEPESVTYAAKR